MEAAIISSSSLAAIPVSSAKPSKPSTRKVPIAVAFSSKTFTRLSLSYRAFSCVTITRASSPSTTSASETSTSSNTISTGHQRHWMVLMEPPPAEKSLNSKPEIIDYYVKTLERVLGSEKDAQMCIYDASCNSNFGFCCDIDEATAREIASLPGVRLVRHDPDFNSVEKDYSLKAELNTPSSSYTGNPYLFPAGTSRYWLVLTASPPVELVSKAEVIDYYVQILTKVLGNEMDAQVCMYHISWQINFGFCCELDAECARDLAGVPGVISVSPDNDFGSDDKDYGGENQNCNIQNPSSSNQLIKIKTKKLFVTGLSFYTSEKTLRAAFEGFGELVEVKIIMDKISKRSKGYAFVEYTTEEAASTALREMNGKIINGWMITVDVAKKNPQKYSRGRPRQST